MKNIISFIGQVSGTKGRLAIITYMIFALLEFPAFVFHELMHLIVAFIFGHDLKIIEWSFFSIKKRNTKHTMKVYRLVIQYSSTKLVGIIGTAAPLIGWLIAITILSLTQHWFILAYFIFGIRMFFLSAQDIQTMRVHGFNEKICNAFFKVERALKADISFN